MWLLVCATPESAVLVFNHLCACLSLLFLDLMMTGGGSNISERSKDSTAAFSCGILLFMLVSLDLKDCATSLEWAACLTSRHTLVILITCRWYSLSDNHFSVTDIGKDGWERKDAKKINITISFCAQPVTPGNSYFLLRMNTNHFFWTSILVYFITTFFKGLSSQYVILGDLLILYIRVFPIQNFVHPSPSQVPILSIECKFNTHVSCNNCREMIFSDQACIKQISGRN